MDVSSACNVLISGFVDAPYSLKQSNISPKQYCNNTNTPTEGGVMEKLGNALTRILQVHDTQLPLSGCDSLSVDHSELFDAATQEIFIKNDLPDLVSVDEKDEVPDMSLSLKGPSEILVCEHPTSLPTPPKKLVSALKGSREKQGLPLKKLTVTWDPDVRDPSVTSRSHTVKSHSLQRSRSKKSSKHKHKSKTSQGSSSSSSKRYHKHSGRSDYRSKSTLSSSEGLLSGGGYNPHSVLELMDFTVTDSKCSSSFLKTSLDKVFIPVAEAT